MTGERSDRPADRAQRPTAGPVDEMIREAMARGDFDNLPGRGRRLQLDGDSRDENFLAQKVLSDAGYVPPWLDLEREIEREKHSLRTAVSNLRSRIDQARSRSPEDSDLEPRVQAEVARARETYARRVQALSERVVRFNLMVPIKARQMRGVLVEEWLQAFDSDLSPGAD